MSRILIVEDEVAIADLEKDYLELSGFEVEIELYKRINGHYPSMNCTVGEDILNKADETITFFKQFDNRITFSRMIGKYGISLEAFNLFLKKAAEQLYVRTGGYDCTMYGGMCGKTRTEALHKARRGSLSEKNSPRAVLT